MADGLAHHNYRACNHFKSGNLIEYRKELINKYEEKIVKKLEQAHYFKTTKKKLNQLEISGLYQFYKIKVEEMLNSKFI